MTYTPYPFTLGILFLLGCFQTIPNLVGLTLCQKIVPERLLGRFFGLLNVFTTSAYVTGMLIGGLVASESIVWMYRGAGFLAVLFFLYGLICQRRLRGRIDHSDFISPSRNA
jgi:MFS family permease